MAHEKLGTPNWEALPWEQTPYSGVSICLLSEGVKLQDSDIPSHSLYAVRLDPASTLRRHIHKREPNWREEVTLPEDGDFIILRADESMRALGKQLVVTIRPYEVFGIENYGMRPLFFTSKMTPGFTGYQEIEEVT